MKYVAISYREDGYGKGAFYDHFTVRNMTAMPSKVARADGVSTVRFANYVNMRAGENRYGLPLDNNIPQAANDYAEDAAFLFIPGYSRNAEKSNSPAHRARIQFESRLIQKAIYRGQPVLAVCAGSWTLWKAFGGELKEVKDHNYGGAMPKLSKQSAKICNNKMVHKIKAENGSKLHEEIGSTAIQVNSVHWRAVDQNSAGISSNIQIAAYSQHDRSITIQTRQQTTMRPERCVEAFETKRGVPMIGVQWHPEAFNMTDTNALKHQSVFRIAKAAGDVYLNRRAWNKEFKQHWQENAFSRTSFFRPAKQLDDTQACEEALKKLTIS